MSDLSGKTTIVVGASRGLGRGAAVAFAEAGAPVIAVSRTEVPFDDPANGSGSIKVELGDATDPALAADLLGRYQPDILVLSAGAVPHMVPLQEQTWETFALTWETDVKMAFHWLREVLNNPLRPGSRVIVVSSGAAMAGSPLSGGYAGAKSTQRFITGYAQDEANLANMGVTFTAVMPRITHLGGVGKPAVTAYAARSGQSEEAYLRSMGPALSPEILGSTLVELAKASPSSLAPAYLVTGGGMKPMG